MRQFDIQEKLIDILLKIPVLRNRDNRDILLFRLSSFSAIIPRSNVNVTDIVSIVNVLGSAGQLTNGEWPLAILIRNAQRFSPPDTELGRELQILLGEFELSYNEKAVELPELIIGTDERLSIDFLQKALVAQKSVARLLVPRISNNQPLENSAGCVTGTGWLIGPCLLLTNYHVIKARYPTELPPSSSDMQVQLQGTVAWFGYNHWDATHTDYRCVELVQCSDRLDYALLRMEKKPLFGDTPITEWGYLSVIKSATALAKGARLNIIQHSRGEEKKIAIRSNFYVGSNSSHDQPSRIQYLTDTEPGASGSPVLNDNWQVIALHHASVKFPDTKYNGEVIKYSNQGIDIRAIVEDLSETIQNQLLCNQEGD